MARITTFKFALNLTPSQRHECLRYAGAARKAFNWGLALVKSQLDQRRLEIESGQLPFTQVCLSRNQLIPAFNAFKLGPEGKADGIASWYKEVSKYCFEEALVDLSRAFSAFFRSAGTSRRVGFPRFRKRGRDDSFRLRCERGGAVSLGHAESARTIRLPKLGWVKVFRRHQAAAASSSPRS